MKTPGKIILMVVIGIVVIAAAILLSQNINKDKLPDSQEQTNSNQTADNDKNDESENDNKEENKDPDNSDSAPENLPAGEAIPEGGTIFTDISDKTNYEVTVSPDEYTYVPKDDSNRFYYTSEDNTDVFVEFKFIKGVDSETLAPSFPDQYLNSNYYEDFGVCLIPGTTLYGDKIIAKNNDLITESYLHDVEGGTLAIVISYAADSSQDVIDKLYETVGTLVVMEVSQ